MENLSQKALETIGLLDFPRACGSPGETRAMRLIAQEIGALGIKPGFHRFRDWWIEPVHPRLTVGPLTIPVEPAIPLPWIEVLGQWMDNESTEVTVSGTLIESGADSTVCDGEALVVRNDFSPGSANSPGATGQILLFGPVPEFIPYSLAEDGFAPSAYVTGSAQDRVLRHLGENATLSWGSKRLEREFQNLTLRIPGTTFPEEMVAMGAHIDTFPGTVGSSDDAAGCAVLLEAARWFTAHPPERTLWLVWFTGEELDRRGSRHFVEDHDLRADSVRIFINVDGGFEREGGDLRFQPSDERMARWAGENLRVPEIEARIGVTISSDAQAFHEREIPIFWITGSSRQRAHLPTDCPEAIDRRKLDLISRTSIRAAALAANGEIPR